MQLCGTSEADSELVIAHPDQLQPPRVDNGLDGRVGGCVEWLRYRVDQTCDPPALPWRGHRDEWSLQRTGLQTHKHSFGHEVLTGSLEGMDHALDGDSSKGPAEERDVEGTAAAHRFSLANAERDVGVAFSCSASAGARNFRGIRFDRDHASGVSCVFKREPTVSTSQLQDPPVLELGEAPDDPDLHPRRRIVHERYGRLLHGSSRRYIERLVRWSV